jgi:FkbM family methyltransferase
MSKLDYYKKLLKWRIKPIYLKFNNQKIYFPIFSECIALLEEIFINKIYEIKLIYPNLMIDEGSNIGVTALYFSSKFPNLKILYFEPNPSASKYLEKNTKKNKITCYNYGLGSSERTSNLYSNQAGSTTATLYTHHEKFPKIDKVVIKKLSSYVNSEVQLLKIDTEGAEFEILEDLLNSRKIRFIKNMIVEFHMMSLNSKIIEYHINQIISEGFKVEYLPADKFSDNTTVFFRKIA